MKHWLAWTVLALAAVSAAPVLAGSDLPGTAFPHTEPMNGLNTFPASSHLVENPYCSPHAGGDTQHSDAMNESSATAWTGRDSQDRWCAAWLATGYTMDVREAWLTWNSASVFIGVQGPNSLWDDGDLFIAIDVIDGGTNAAPWNRSVDFEGWQPDRFIAVERPVSDAPGYAVLMDSASNIIKTFQDGEDAADSGWRSAADGGMFYEFAISFDHLGFTPGPGRSLRLSVYTTHEHDGCDVYDTIAGFGQGTVCEQLGDYPGDADFDWESCCAWLSSDCSYGAGNPTRIWRCGTEDRVYSFPGSDYIGCDLDTIVQHLEVLNAGALPSTWPATWTPTATASVSSTPTPAPTVTPTFTPTLTPSGPTPTPTSTPSTGPTPTPLPLPATSATGSLVLAALVTCLLLSQFRRCGS